MDSVTFPENFAQSCDAVQKFNNVIFVSASRADKVLRLSENFQWEFTLSAEMNNADKEIIMNFYNARFGESSSFKFKNFTDNTLVNETQVNPNPATTMQIYKYFTNCKKKIKMPTAGTVVVKDNGSTLTLTTDYTVSSTTGIITFAGIYPVAGHTYTVSCDYLVEVRFIEWSGVQMVTPDRFNITGLKLREVL